MFGSVCRSVCLSVTALTTGPFDPHGIQSRICVSLSVIRGHLPSASHSGQPSFNFENEHTATVIRSHKSNGTKVIWYQIFNYKWNNNLIHCTKSVLTMAGTESKMTKCISFDLISLRCVLSVVFSLKVYPLMAFFLLWKISYIIVCKGTVPLLERMG